MPKERKTFIVTQLPTALAVPDTSGTDLDENQPAGRHELGPTNADNSWFIGKPTKETSNDVAGQQGKRIWHKAPTNTAWTNATDAAFRCYSLCNMVTGPDADNRIGRQIRVERIRIRMNYAQDPTTTPLPLKGAFGRCLLVCDHGWNNGSYDDNSVSAPKLFVNAGTPSTSPMNLSYQDRFKVLRDTRFYCQQTWHPGKHFEWDIKCAIPITYSASNDTRLNISDIVTNHIYLVVALDKPASGVASSDHLQYVVVTSELIFTDA